MCSDVLLKMRELGKLSLTDLTPVGFNTKMNAHVLGQVGAVGKRFAALCTLVGLGLSHVHLCV